MALLLLPNIIKCLSALETEQGCSLPEASLITPEKNDDPCNLIFFSLFFFFIRHLGFNGVPPANSIVDRARSVCGKNCHITVTLKSF